MHRTEARVTSDVFDRLLEHVLREELAPTAPTSDLSARVAVALAARAAPAAAPAMPRARGAPRRRWLQVAIAAAAGVALAVTWLAVRRPGLTCSRALLVAVDADEPFAPRTRLPAATFAWCTGDGDVALTAGDGTKGTAVPGCAFAVDSPRRTAELVTGTLELRVAGAPWRIACAGVEVLVADGCAVRCALTSEASPLTERTATTMTPNDLRAHLRDLAAPSLLTVLVLAGTAELTTAQDKQPLAAGSSRAIDVGSERDAAARALQLYQEVRKDLPPASDEASRIAAKGLEDRFHELTGLVLRRT